jgi:hypothetical protein
MMTTYRRPFDRGGLRTEIAGLFLLIWLIGVCHYAWGLEVSPADKQAYYDALAATETATQEKISTKLLAIVPDWDPVNHERLRGGEIVWEGLPGQSRLLVGTFMSRANYQKYYAPYLNDQEYHLTKSLWVTVVPELKNFFIGQTCPPTKERVRQLLGLNPAYPFEVFLEMWVFPSDLFRPSPDPETNDHEGMLSRQIAPGNWTFPQNGNPFIRIDDTALFLEAAWLAPKPFKQWFMDRAETIYHRDGEDPSGWGDPWTRLGYSYDWGNPVNPVGMSEFILRIHPDTKELVIKLEKAVDADTVDWSGYFKCLYSTWFPLIFNN